MKRIYQRIVFIRLSKKFREVVASLQKLGTEPFIMPFWRNINNSIEKSFRLKPGIDFLSNRAIVDTMFVVGDKVWLEKQIKYLKTFLKKDFKKTTQEDMVGSPQLIPSHNTSHNTIHHLYHLLYFENTTKIRLKNIASVIEWGGGYGNMAKLWRRHFNKTGTYIIIDTALFSSIQWLYLSTTIGKNKVHLLNNRHEKIIEGKINLLPLALLKKIDLRAELFISTWGLSESKKEAQDYVVNKKWFGAKHLLIGFQDSTKELRHASRLGELAKKEGAQIIDIEFIPNNHYAIKK